MVTLAQRIEALRTERGLSRPALAAELGCRKAPLKSLRPAARPRPGSSRRSSRATLGSRCSISGARATTAPGQETWMDAAWDQDEPARPAPAPRPAPPQAQPSQPGGGMLDALLASKQTQQLLRSIVLDTLRSPGGPGPACQPEPQRLAGGR